VITRYGYQFTCDVDQVVSPVGPPVPVDGVPLYSQIPMPDGWLNLGLLELTFRSTVGANIYHLCPGCAALDLAGLVARVRAREQAEQEARQS
jgi:hypothetical protein